MAAGKEIEGSNPLGTDNSPGGDTEAADSKKYIKYYIDSTKHLFTAPKEKYNDVKDELGVKEYDSASDADKKLIRKLKRGTGFVQIAISLKGGASLRLACDPAKLGTLSAVTTAKCYGVEIDSAYIPKTQSNR